MENIHKQSELIDDIKEKLTDAEYKNLMENLAEIKNKNEIFVKFLCISPKAEIVTIEDDDQESLFVNSISGCENDIKSWRFMKCSIDCDCCNGFNRIDVDVSLVKEILVRKVTDYKNFCSDQRQIEIPKSVYEHMKTEGYTQYGEQMLIYICDM